MCILKFVVRDKRFKILTFIFYFSIFCRFTFFIFQNLYLIMNIQSLKDFLIFFDDQISQKHSKNDTSLSFKRRKYRRYAIIFKWRLISHRIKFALCLWVMRYEKLEQVKIDVIVREIIKKNMFDEDIYYRKKLSKTISNMITWKHKSLKFMKINTYHSISSLF
jgi:hypothetical protein